MTVDIAHRISGRRTLAAIAVAAVVAVAMPASGQQLVDALAITHDTNPTLIGQRESLRGTNEQVSQALSGYRPNVEATGDIGYQYSDTDPASGSSSSDSVNPASIGISVSQPLYRGGRTTASVRSAQFAVQAARATYQSIEQQVLLDAVTAYMDVVREQAVLELSLNNEQVLRRQLQATRDRFQVGEVTRTDVSQAESRLARATADRIAAEGDLDNARATFARVIGQTAGAVSPPPPVTGLPGSLDESIALAEANNPAIITANFNERSADANVDVVFGELLPEVSLVGQARSNFEPSENVDQSDTASLTAQVTVPLYQSGAVSSRVREARYAANQSRIHVEETRRDVVENAIQAWETLTTARASIQSLVTQVSAARIALEGTEQEALVGSRTVLDVLDAEQELLDARVSLVRAQRDEVVATYGLLAVTGQLTARALGLPVEYYDFDPDYRSTRNRIWGTSVQGD